MTSRNGDGPGPTKRCSWGQCKSDTRYSHREHMKDVYFIPFPKPKRQEKRCLEWIAACGRPTYQLNV